MKNVLTLAGLLVVCSLATFAQGYDTMPVDARVFPIGVAGTPYDDMRLGVQGGALNVACLEDPRTWNDAVAHGASTWRFTSRMLCGLVDIDPITGQLVPDLCRTWTISEDGLRITFSLRRGIRWSDGTPITTDDVIFTAEDVVLNEDVDCDSRDGLKLPDSTYPRFSKIDDYTVAVDLSVTFRPILNALGFSILPRHALSRFVHKLNPDVPPGTFNETWSLDTPLDELVCSGPYVPVEYVPNQRVMLERNAYYWAYDPAGTQLPYYDKFVSHIVSNQDVSMLKFRNGEVDCFAADAQYFPVLVPEASQNGFTVMHTDLPERGTTWLSLNQDIGLEDGTNDEKRELYRNRQFREAIAHCIDKSAMINYVLNGLGVRLWSPVNILSPFYGGRDYYGGPITENDAVWFEYDQARAAIELDALGVIDRDGDGWRDLPSGAPLTIELNTNDNTTRIDYGLIIQDDLRAAGLNCNFWVSDFSTLVGDLLAGTGDMTLLGLTGGDEPHCSVSTYSPCGSLHVSRLSAWHDPNETDLRIDELYSLGANTWDLDEAFGYYQKAQHLIAEQLDFIFLVGELFTYAYYDYVGNAHMASPLSSPDGTNGLLTELLFDTRLL